MTMTMELFDPTTLITDDTTVTALKAFVLGCWSTPPTTASSVPFPGPMPVSIRRSNLTHNLKRWPYLITTKSDGVRVFVVSTSVDGSTITAVVDRNFRFYRAALTLATTGFVLDGELLRNRQIIVHDCIYAHGRSLTSERSFIERYRIANDIIKVHYREIGSDFLLRSKRFYTYRELDDLRSRLEDPREPVDGLIFVPLMKEIGRGRQNSLFKWKQGPANTIDLRLTDNDKEYTASMYSGVGGGSGKEIPFASIRKTQQRASKQFVAILRQNCPEYRPGDIVEFYYDHKDDNWIPIKVRKDKGIPNSAETVEKTIRNVDENISLDEILAALRGV